MACLGGVPQCVLSLAAVVTACWCAVPTSAAEPFTYLYDAPQASSGATMEEWLSRKSGWSKLEEDDTAHRFAGCAVFVNDQIVAVLSQDAADVEVYSRRTQGLKLCARLQPVCEGDSGLKRTSLSIKENTLGTVSLEIEFRSAGNEHCHVIYELNAGRPFVKTTAGPGVERLRVQAPCRFAVMPDFFGDDIAVDASTISAGRAELPSENFLLHMMHGGEAILMTVSESRDNEIEIALSDSRPRRIVSSDISYGEKPHIWIAILADEGIWHRREIELADAGRVIDLDWRMPFAALWRVDWGTVDKLTDSWEMLLQNPEGNYVMQEWLDQDESKGQRFGKELGGRDWNKPERKRWNPVLGQFTFPCWIDNQGRGHLQPLEKRRYSGRGEVYNFSGPAIVYPIDRVKIAPFRTPLEKLTVVDLVRMTLGVGPCEYILDLEGQKRNSQGVATCYARDVIDAIYKEGTQLQNGPAIEEHLAAAVAFIRNVRERIDQYVAFGREMKRYLEEEKRLHPEHAEFLDELLLLNERLDQSFEQSRQRIRTPDYADDTAERFRKELLTYTQEDAFAKCDTQMRIFTSIGGAQDGLVASCRMIVKILRQRAGIAMAENPELKEIAAEVRARTQAVLRNPTPYEAPRH